MKEVNITINIYLFFIATIFFSNTFSNIFGKEINQKYLAKSKRQEKIVFLSKETENSTKKIERAGILTINPKAKATILICHGFMCDKFDSSFLRIFFKDYNTFSFDFRAHGENSEDQCCTLGYNEYHDVMGAVRYLKSRSELKDIPLIVYAFSMGAVSSILAQAKNQNLFDAMILDCPFESSDKLIDRGLERIYLDFFGYKLSIPLPYRWILKQCAYHPFTQSLIKYAFKSLAQMDATRINTCILPVYPVKAMENINIPVFLIVCENDDKAPLEAVQEIYKAAAGPKRLWITKGRRHYDSIFYNPEKYEYKVNRFIYYAIDNNWKNKSKIYQDK